MLQNCNYFPFLKKALSGITFFEQLDFRRFQVDLRESIEMDDASKIAQLTRYGDELGRKILNDETDRALEITAARAPR